MRATCVKRSLLAAALALGVTAPARAELRISDLDVFLNDHEVTVHVVLFGAIPDAFQEGIQGGIPTHVRFTVELWQYKRYWPDKRLTTKLVERSLAYNVVPRSSGSRPSRVRRGPSTSRGTSATPSASCPSSADSK